MLKEFDGPAAALTGPRDRAGTSKEVGSVSEVRVRAIGETDPLVQAYEGLLAIMAHPPGGSLLSQTIVIAKAHRLFASLVKVRPGATVVDLGTGYGVVAFELARLHRASVYGVDIDHDVLRAARDVGEQLGGSLAGTVAFVESPVERLPCVAGSVDVVTASLLFQHVPSPEAVVTEIHRVLRPGGIAAVVDVDDGFSATYPDLNGPLEAAFAAWQSSYGGDRLIGRKLPVLLAERGLGVDQIFILPQARLESSAPGGQDRLMAAERLVAARDPMAEAGILDRDTFDRCLDAYLLAPEQLVTRIEARIVVLATKP